MTTRQRRRVAVLLGSVITLIALAFTLISPANAHVGDVAPTGLSANSASDPPANLPPLIKRYGAIAYSPDGSQGIARRHVSKLGAELEAMKRCGAENCTVVSTFTQCGAVAHDGATYHGGFGHSRGTAEANAMSRLGGGWIVGWACN